MRRTILLYLLVFLLLLGSVPYTAYAQGVEPSREEIIFWTQQWEGERYPSGRPKVPDDLLERMKNVSIEEAWGVLRAHGYHNQFAGDWKMVYQDRPMIGRALTAQYMPSSPALRKRMTARGHAKGHTGPMNSWPIDMLQQGDVYVADAFGKVKGGTLIGNNLASAIYNNSGNGVIFNGSLRDLGAIEEMEGFNAFVRGWHPSFLVETMLTGINTPIRIEGAIVLPGDVVLARREGVLFIPAYLAREVVETAEVVALRDKFSQQRMREGTYTPGQIDSRWTEAIREDFFNWLDENMGSVPISKQRIREILEEQRTW